MANDDGIVELFKQTYTDVITASAQQMESVFTQACQRSKESNSAASAIINRMLVAPNPQAHTVRYQPVTYAETDYVRRWIKPYSAVATTRFDLAEYEESALGNLQSEILKNHTFSIKRDKDRKFVEGFYGAIEEGNPQFTSNVLVPFSTANTIPVDYGSTSNIGLTANKLDRALKMLVASHAYRDGDKIWVAVSSQQEVDLRQCEELRNSLYFKDKTTEDASGMIASYGSFRFIRYEELPTGATSTIRRCPYWIDRGMHMADWEDLKVSIFSLPEVGRNTVGIKLYHTVNFGRKDEVYCGEILCEES
jgi:hypothetical protein